MSLGILIALPFMLSDVVGLQMPIGAAKGPLVADIGMTLDDVKQRSKQARAAIRTSSC
jgi:hypothetical protein